MKPVTATDARIFGKKCVGLSIRETALVMISERQARLDRAALTGWTDSFGIGLTLFHGWDEFVEQVLFWCEEPKLVADGLRVVIYPNDHRPAHVHVIGQGGEAVFILHCPDGPPELRESYNFNRPEPGRIRTALTAELVSLCNEWSKIHDHY